MAPRTDRSRSPPADADGANKGTGVSVEDDVAAAQRVRKAYKAPKQSKFRVAAVLRFVRPDGSEGTLEAVNAEPHDANIRGAICAERAALCTFQREEAALGARVVRVVCVTDHSGPIFPGPLCREFLTSVCGPDVEVVAAGAGSGAELVVQPLCELLPMPSVYRLKDQDAVKAIGATLGTRVCTPADSSLAATYEAAVTCARKQGKQALVFPVLFAAAVRFANGRVHSAAELKGIEYGCTVDAVSLLLPEMIRSREEGEAAATCLIQADQFGVAHAPFASARSLLVEHGFGDVLVCAHDDNGKWVSPLTARESIPHANFFDMF